MRGVEARLCCIDVVSDVGGVVPRYALYDGRLRWTPALRLRRPTVSSEGAEEPPQPPLHWGEVGARIEAFKSHCRLPLASFQPPHSIRLWPLSVTLSSHYPNPPRAPRSPSGLQPPLCHHCQSNQQIRRGGEEIEEAPFQMEPSKTPHLTSRRARAICCPHHNIVR